jgi:hypothetical protein
MPGQIASESAPQLVQLAVEEYPEEHVRTGATRDSITGRADGPVVIVEAGTSYAQYVDGAIPGALRESWVAVLNDSVMDVGNGILGGS